MLNSSDSRIIADIPAGVDRHSGVPRKGDHNGLVASRDGGFALIEFLTVLAALAALGIVVFTIASAISYFFFSPAALSITPKRSVIASNGGFRDYTLTATYSSPATAAGVQEINIREDDFFDEILDASVLVSYGAGSTAGTGSFRLLCVSTRGILVGDDNRSEEEDEYDVYAEYGNFLAPDIQSPNVKIQCE